VANQECSISAVCRSLTRCCAESLSAGIRNVRTSVVWHTTRLRYMRTSSIEIASFMAGRIRGVGWPGSRDAAGMPPSMPPARFRHGSHADRCVQRPSAAEGRCCDPQIASAGSETSLMPLSDASPLLHAALAEARSDLSQGVVRTCSDDGLGRCALAGHGICGQMEWVQCTRRGGGILWIDARDL